MGNDGAWEYDEVNGRQRINEGVYLRINTG